MREQKEEWVSHADHFVIEVVVAAVDDAVEDAVRHVKKENAAGRKISKDKGSAKSVMSKK